MIWKEKTVKLKDVKPSDYNPRKISDHDYQALKRSLKEFGHAYPMICNKDLRVIGGHMTLKAAKELGWKEIKVSLPDQQIPPEKEKALNLALNRIHGSWDDDKLQLILSELYDSNIDIELTGFEETEIDQIIKELYEPEEEEIPEPPKEPKAKRGDIYQLGRHRIMCGDSTSKEDMELLMDGGGANMVLTDPPYNVNYSSKNELLNLYDKGNKIQTDIINDAFISREEYNQFIKKAFTILQKHVTKYNTVYAFGNAESIIGFYDIKELYISNILVWVKNNLILGRQDYKGKHENIVYGWFGKHKWHGNNSQTTVLEYDKPLKSELHPTQKPINLLIHLIKNSSKKGEAILDPFGGSGGTLIACEQTERICYMMEISEAYTDVIITRWENLTNKKAVKIS